MMDPLGVWAGITAATSHLRHVRISEWRITEICAGLRTDDLKLPTWDFPVFYRRDPIDRLLLALCRSCVMLVPTRFPGDTQMQTASTKTLAHVRECAC